MSTSTALKLYPHKYVFNWRTGNCADCRQEFEHDFHNRYAIESHDNVVQRHIEAWITDLDSLGAEPEDNGVQVWKAEPSRLSLFFMRLFSREAS